MSEANITSLFSWTDAAGEEQVLDVDVVMAATDKRTVEFTKHPIESGANITDHAIIQPERVSLTLVVTQTPIQGGGLTSTKLSLDAPGQALKGKDIPIKVQPSAFEPGGYLMLSQGLRNVVSAGLGALGLPGGGNGLPSKFKGTETYATTTNPNVSTLQLSSPEDRVIAVHDKLIEIQTDVLPVTISFKGRIYTDYVLTEVEMNHEAGKFGSATFKVEAEALATVEGASVSLPDPADFRAIAKAKKGAKPPKVPNPDPTKVVESEAYDLFYGNGDGIVSSGFKALLPGGGT